MRPALAALAALIPIMATVTATAEIYRYTDANGAEHFTMDLRAVPKPYREEAARRAEEGAKRIQIMPSDSRLDSRLGPEPAPEGRRPDPGLPDTFHWDGGTLGITAGQSTLGPRAITVTEKQCLVNSHYALAHRHRRRPLRYV